VDVAPQVQRCVLRTPLQLRAVRLMCALPRSRASLRRVRVPLFRVSLAAYYYRVNYFLIVVLLFVGAFVRYPLAFFAAAGAVFTTLCLNDSFSHTIRHASIASS
jgi:hypothetical protein